MAKSAIKHQLHRFIAQGPDSLAKGAAIILIISGIGVTMAMFIQVILRYVFHSPLFGIEEILIIVICWFYFIGAGYASYKKSYIVVDVLPLVVKNQLLLRQFKVACLILSIVALILLGYFSLEYCQWAATSNIKTQTFELSVNYSSASIVVGVGLMLLYMSIQLGREFRELRQGSKHTVEKKS